MGFVTGCCARAALRVPNLPRARISTLRQNLPPRHQATESAVGLRCAHCQNLRLWQVGARYRHPAHLVDLFCARSAKTLVPGNPNVAYICSRYYRAPELVFEATEYTCAIGARGQELPARQCSSILCPVLLVICGLLRSFPSVVLHSFCLSARIDDSVLSDPYVRVCACRRVVGGLRVRRAASREAHLPWRERRRPAD